jgi:hypothetical protein
MEELDKAIVVMTNVVAMTMLTPSKQKRRDQKQK